MSRTSAPGEALKALARKHGKPWPDVLTDWANAGYTWTDAAGFLDLPVESLKAYCHYRKLKFPWQGIRSPIERDRQRRCWADRGMAGDKYAPRYTVQGITGTMTELCEHFSIHRSTVWTRIRRKGMTLEAALTAPVKTRQEVGDLAQAALKSSGNRSNFWKNEGRLNYAKAPPAHA